MPFSRWEESVIVAAALFDVARGRAVTDAENVGDDLQRPTTVDMPSIEVRHLLESIDRYVWPAGAGLADRSPTGAFCVFPIGRCGC